MVNTVIAPNVGVWQDAAAADEVAVAALYDQFVPALISYAHRRGAEDAEGVASLAFFHSIKALPNLQAQNAPVFQAYAYRVVRNQIAGQFRRPTVDVVSLPEEGALEQFSDAGPTPEESVTADIGFESMLALLTPEQQQVFQHRFRAGHSVTETARLLDRTPASVHGLQERGLRKLRFLAALVVVVVGAYVPLLPELRTTAVTYMPTDQPPTVSIPANEDNEPEANNTQTGVVHDVNELRVRLQTPERTGSKLDESPEKPLDSAASLDTTAEPILVGSVMRPASVPEMCLGFNKELVVMELQNCRDTLDQRWELRPSVVEGYFELAVLGTGQCMYVEDFSRGEGARIVGSACGFASDHGLWEYSGGPTMDYDGAPLISRHAGMCVTVDDNSRHDGAPISQRSCGLAMYQVFSYDQGES